VRRSEINQLIRDADACFQRFCWTIPPAPKWDVTDFGLGDWQSHGLVLLNLSEEPEYCEKLMYAKAGMVTPAHSHAKKTEDIISRRGVLRVQFWKGKPELSTGTEVSLRLNGEAITLPSGAFIDLHSGWRVKITPGIYHEFIPLSEECIIGEVSTANDDANDNFFINPNVGRYPHIEEDELPVVRLVSDK
jgi:D-lyxose ketol-isomerase